MRLFAMRAASLVKIRLANRNWLPIFHRFHVPASRLVLGRSLLPAALLVLAGLADPLQANPGRSVPSDSGAKGGDVSASLLQGASDAAQLAQAPAVGADTHTKSQETAKNTGRSRLYGLATKPGFFTVVEQSTAWVFPATGSRWGTGAASGSTFVGLGVSGNVKGVNDNLMTWSVQAGPAFQHEYNVPGNDRTPLRIDGYWSVSPGRGNDFNIYAAWRGLFGNDVFGQNRVQNTVRTGVIYSFARSRIIPDAAEQINLPEQGFYARVEPTWIFGLDGQLNQAQTQAYLGLSETFYPFTFAIEVGPQFVQTRNRNLQTILGSFFDIGYVINGRTRAYVRYRPALSFGGSDYPAANQLLVAGLNYRF